MAGGFAGELLLTAVEVEIIITQVAVEVGTDLTETFGLVREL